MAKRTRRSSEEVKKLAEQAKALVDGGKTAEQAAAEVGISSSVYARYILGRVYKQTKASQVRRKKKKARVEHRTSAETARIAAEARRRIDAGEKLYDVLGDLHMSDNTYYKYKNKKGGRH